jgi:hypothetical protein
LAAAQLYEQRQIGMFSATLLPGRAEVIVAWFLAVQLGSAGVLVAYRVRFTPGAGSVPRWVGIVSGFLVLSEFARPIASGMGPIENLESVVRDPVMVAATGLLTIWGALGFLACIPRRSSDRLLVVFRWTSVLRLCAPAVVGSIAITRAYSLYRFPAIGAASHGLKTLASYTYPMLIEFVGISAFIEERLAPRSRASVAQVFA